MNKLKNLFLEGDFMNPLKIYCEECEENFTVISGPSLIDFCCPECGSGKTETVE